jgi:hypothetical protein
MPEHDSSKFDRTAIINVDGYVYEYVPPAILSHDFKNQPVDNVFKECLFPQLESFFDSYKQFLNLSPDLLEHATVKDLLVDHCYRLNADIHLALEHYMANMMSYDSISLRWGITSADADTTA